MPHNLDRDVVEEGDLCQYVMGMPGPDYFESSATDVKPDGSFRLYDSGFKIWINDARLTDRSAPVHNKSCFKVTRPGVNGF